MILRCQTSIANLSSFYRIPYYVPLCLPIMARTRCYVDQSASHYKKAFAQTLPRHAKPLFADALSLVTLVPSDKIHAIARAVHKTCTQQKKKIGIMLFGLGAGSQLWLQHFLNSTPTDKETFHVLGLASEHKVWFTPFNTGTLSMARCI